ncbi:MAG: GNAT family N-acetyltransferase [Nitrosospira sp.]|nr:GNAT family N-acetyltransferase [Nitrosospira sp.]
MDGYLVRTANWQDDGRALKLIRETVFIGEQGIPPELEWDEFDTNCTHLLAIDTLQNPIGTARLLPAGSIGRMAVLKYWRGKRVGSALMESLLEEALVRQLPLVTLNAQTHAAGFYTRFGFRRVENEFLDAGIPHVRMVLQLRAI